MFVVAGVSGNTGSVVARTLLDAGKKVRVLVRDAAKGEEWKKRGAELAVASMEDAAALTKALQGAEGAYFLIPPPPPSSSGIRERSAKIADAVAQAIDASGVKHVVFLSSIGADRADVGIVSTLHAAEDRVRKTKGAVTFLRAAYFVENNAAVLPLAQNQGILPTNLVADHRIPMVTTRDIGQTAAKLLAEGAKANDKRVVNLAGKEDLTPTDLAKHLSDLVGKPVKVASSPADDSMVATLQSFGFSAEMAQLFREMTAAVNDGRVKWSSDPLLRGTQPVQERLAQLLGKSS